MADDAVGSEPVSRGNSLLTGNLTGNFEKSAAYLPVLAFNLAVNSNRCEGFLCTEEQGIALL
jgi:hypothetical protein